MCDDEWRRQNFEPKYAISGCFFNVIGHERINLSTLKARYRIE